jgi:tetratricopeptide (TPR) repeat protein
MRLAKLTSIALLAAVAMFAQDLASKVTPLVKEKKFDEAAKLLESEGAKVKPGKPSPQLADAHVVLGNGYMYEESLPPFQKYPAALRQFRAALKFDPENKKAKQNIATIEGIYKSMGRPIPQ